MERVIEEAKDAFPEAAFEFDTRNNASPAFQRNLERFTAISHPCRLHALVVFGGVGVANATRAFVDRRRVPFATLKSLGATAASSSRPPCSR